MYSNVNKSNHTTYLATLPSLLKIKGWKALHNIRLVAHVIGSSVLCQLGVQEGLKTEGRQLLKQVRAIHVSTTLYAGELVSTYFCGS